MLQCAAQLSEIQSRAIEFCSEKEKGKRWAGEATHMSSSFAHQDK